MARERLFKAKRIDNGEWEEGYYCKYGYVGIENARQKYQRLVKEQGEKEDEAMNIHFRGVMNIVKEEGGIDD